MSEQEKALGAPAARTALDDAGLLEKMLGALTTIQESVQRFEYLQSQIEKLTKEELALEEARRAHMIRLNTAMTVLNGFLCAGGLSIPPSELITSAVRHADMLIARLGLDASASEPAVGPPEET